jgi:hypothetical protein
LQLSDVGPLPLTPQQHSHATPASVDRVTRSRTSSVNSQASGDAGYFPALAAATSLAVRQYALPSDAESSIGGDDDRSASTPVVSPGGLDTVTKEDLFKQYQRMMERAYRNKNKFSQVRMPPTFLYLKYSDQLSYSVSKNKIRRNY